MSASDTEPGGGGIAGKVRTMIILGVVLLIVGFIFSIPILWTIGLILVAVGVVLMILGATGRTVAGRRYWY